MARNNHSTTTSKLPHTKVSHKSSLSSYAVNENKTSDTIISLREHELSMQILKIDDEKIPLIEISKQGDVILDVTFQNSSDCTRSIVPKDHKPNSNKNVNRLRHIKSLAPSSQRICYRVELKLLENISKYFRLLFSTQFAEGTAVQNTIKALREEAAISQGNSEKELNQENDYLLKITDVVKKLPRIKIIDEDLATKTVGRELIFDDILRVIHGLEPKNTPYTTHSWSVLVLLADNYDVVPYLSRYFQKACLNHINRTNSNKNEVLRQKILIQYYIEKGPRFASSTKDLIMRGFSSEESTKNYTEDMKGAWWDLPYGIESEVSYRRACVLRTIASIQNQFLSLYSSRELQCKLGYGSSASCDSFQLGEMVKFLSRKSLLFLISFQPTVSEDYSESFNWPEAYTGDIDTLIAILRQCPSYQLDENHNHCGLRSRLLPALDYIKICLTVGLGIRLIHGKDSNKFQAHFNSWRSSEKSTEREAKPVWVTTENGKVIDCTKDNNQKSSLVFQFAIAAKNKLRWSIGENEARDLFTAHNWNWITEQNVDSERLGTAFGVMK
ncbi:hypothetical protein EPUL_001983 [Erysiphe pulchra]|uniref:BTB domain-containing protein n=1 Tax=Erysiphe pulchra TaxID=225359 RepID=A0A2S4PPU3_9PEZI|nr:hypothetical protein EPUL_001983 [Erysiphe pulchra]